MAYSTSTPPVKLVDALGGTGAIWSYRSTDAVATVRGAGYFSNGSDLGMKGGDIVYSCETDNTFATSVSCVTAVTAGGAATVSALT